MAIDPDNVRVFQPKRATLALDAAGLYGPDVDRACGTYEGNPDGDVDGWELGESVPTPEQVALLAELTRLPVDYFYAPLPPGTETGKIIVCGRGGAQGMGRMRCQTVSTQIVPPAAEARRTHQQGTLF